MGSNPIIFSAFGVDIYASSLVIFLGLVFCLLMTATLYGKKHGTVMPAFMLFSLGFIVAVFLSRVTHWYFNAETYGSFENAMTDFSIGSFVLPVAVAGVWITGWLIGKTRLVPSHGALLDAAAPGLCLLIVFIRISAIFGTTCRGKAIITNSALQFFPWSIAVTDGANNRIYRFASFAIAAILMLLVFVLILLYFRNEKSRSKKNGDVWRWFVLAYSMVSVVIDSTRYDSPLMHFRVISYLNQYSAFISLGQVMPGVFSLITLIHFSKRNIRRTGLKWYHVLGWILLVVSFVGIGYFGEYKFQRYANTLQCYSIMTASCFLLLLAEYLEYRRWGRRRR
ncbi:MAG: prolipoprotein diacylglyceryl transferase [Oscillospiraceae bacterium]|nr:prolipoprotein diacylglyceryl transferase [Oscillospiraceae bacterium]